MADVTILSASKRDRAGKGAARAVRNAGLVPGVIYGDKKEPLMISMAPRDLAVQMAKIGFMTTVFEVDVDGDKHQALARDVQFHPVTDQAIHVDFLRVGKNTRIKVMVPVKFINEDTSPGLKMGGVLNIVRHEVEMISPATAIPAFLTVDLATAELNSSIHFSAVAGSGEAAPTITDRDFTVATIAAPSSLKSEGTDEEEEGAEGEGEEGEGEDTATEE